MRVHPAALLLGCFRRVLRPAVTAIRAPPRPAGVRSRASLSLGGASTRADVVGALAACLCRFSDLIVPYAGGDPFGGFGGGAGGPGGFDFSSLDSLKVRATRSSEGSKSSP